MAESQDEREWDKLNHYQHARLRTEMYLGSRDPHTQLVLEYKNGLKTVETTWVPAIATAFREILDNALDEVVTHNHGNRIDVTYDANTMEMSVTDNGRGIPINWDEKEQNWAATVLMTETMAGRNFKEDRGATRGVNGLGAVATNYCSEYFQMKIERDKKSFEQMFREGTDNLTIEDAVIFPSKEKSGTLIKFKLSNKVFHDMRFPENFVAARIYEVALCYPKLRVVYNGTHIKPKMDSLFAHKKPIFFEIDADNNFSSKFWLVPEFMADGSEHTHSLVNTILVGNGGTHVDMFRRCFFSGLLTALERESKKRKLVPNRSDMADGLLLYNITEMAAPKFDSQSKTRLINENVGAIIRKTMDDPEFYKGVIKDNPEWIDAIYERCRIRTQKSDAIDLAKAAKKTLRQKIEELEDASGHDRSKCILFLTEGKSAIAGLAAVRDPEIHGGLPLRGKVLNVMGESHKTILENEALRKVMTAIGLVPGQRPNRHMLRYSKIYIMTDADPDGGSICGLLLAFFYTCWPSLFDADSEPFVWVFDTPLLIAEKGKVKKYWYADNVNDFDAEKYKNWSITRAKGLAALQEADWKYVMANPKATPIKDDGKLAETIELIFGKAPGAADKRKVWMGI